jgi:aminopeptidase-like protein
LDEVFHTHDDCTGKWTVSTGKMGAVISCLGCGAIFAATRSRIDKALYENWVGAVLDTTANQGVFFLNDREVSGN